MNFSDVFPNIPAPDSGTVVDGAFCMGAMLADDFTSPTDEDAYMKIVCNASEKDFYDYTKKLEKCGISDIFSNSVSDDRFFSFILNGKSYHVAYFSKRNEIRISEDKNVASLRNFNSPSAGTEKSVIYQYGLYYDPDNNCTETTVNCGMLYIIRLSDNRLIMIDGGQRRQWCAESIDALMAFLRKITHSDEGEKIKIAAWYFTHAHSDHTDGCLRLLEKFSSAIEIQRIMHGFASYRVVPKYYSGPETRELKKALRAYCPDAKCLRLHTGQKIELGNASFTVLFAHEDAVEASAPSVFPFTDFNCTSTVLKMELEGKTVMWLGDTNVESEKFIAEHSSPEIWKSDMVQVSHHCFNYLNTLYAWINAPVAMLPNSFGGAHQPENTPKLEAVLACLSDEEKIYYEGEATYSFVPSEKGFINYETFPPEGQPFHQ